MSLLSQCVALGASLPFSGLGSPYLSNGAVNTSSAPHVGEVTLIWRRMHPRGVTWEFFLKSPQGC